jgi:hypothetical protein
MGECPPGRYQPPGPEGGGAGGGPPGLSTSLIGRAGKRGAVGFPESKAFLAWGFSTVMAGAVGSRFDPVQPTNGVRPAIPQIGRRQRPKVTSASPLAYGEATVVMP